MNRSNIGSTITGAVSAIANSIGQGIFAYNLTGRARDKERADNKQAATAAAVANNEADGNTQEALQVRARTLTDSAFAARVQQDLTRKRYVTEMMSINETGKGTEAEAIMKARTYADSQLLPRGERTGSSLSGSPTRTAQTSLQSRYKATDSMTDYYYGKTDKKASPNKIAIGEAEAISPQPVVAQGQHLPMEDLTHGNNNK